MKYTSLQTTDGFTLLEVMIAIVILVIGLLGAGAMQLSSINWNAKASHMTEAANLGMNKTEQILSWDANDPLLANNENVPFQRVGNANDTADQSETVGKYTIYWDGTPRMDPILATKQIAIDLQIYVVWTEGNQLKTIPINFTKRI